MFFTVSESYDGVCVRGFLRRSCGISARQLAKLKRQPDGICRNGSHVIASDLLNAGDRVRIIFPEDTKLPRAYPLPLKTVYEDDDLLVVNKPSGMPMYPTPGHDCDSLANAVAYYQLLKKEYFAFRPVYRLDKDTTGLVVLAKNAYAASQLSGTVRKIYLAVCEGTLSGGGMIDKPLGIRPGHTVQRAVCVGGKRAVTLWRSVLPGSDFSLIAVKLKTGRTHQIRVHFSSIGHPLAGDDMYGGGLEHIGRQALHCAKVRFIHPVTKTGMLFHCKIPDDMLNLV